MREVSTYVYDAPCHTVSFKYDPFGRRIYKSSSSGTSVYAYDGDNLVEETNSSGAVMARYEATQNIDEPLAMLRSGATSYYHADGLGPGWYRCCTKRGRVLLTGRRTRWMLRGTGPQRRTNWRA